MRQTRKWTIAATALIIATLGLWGWLRESGEDDSASAREEPAHVEAIEGTDLHRVILSERAAERLAIQTAPVVDDQAGGTPRRVIPYAAVLYDAQGAAFTYTNPEPLVFVRQPITIADIDGEVAVLTDGPAAGTAVVVVGGIELFGTEYGVGH